MDVSIEGKSLEEKKSPFAKWLLQLCHRRLVDLAIGTDDRLNIEIKKIHNLVTEFFVYLL